MLTDARKKIIYIVLVAISGLAASTIAQALHVVPEVIQPWLDILKVLTPVIGTVWGLNEFGPAGVVRQAAALPPEQAQAALHQIPDEAKVLIAKAVPDVATIVVRNTATNGVAKLAASPTQPDIVTERQNELDALAGTQPRYENLR